MAFARVCVYLLIVVSSTSWADDGTPEDEGAVPETFVGAQPETEADSFNLNISGPTEGPFLLLGDFGENGGEVESSIPVYEKTVTQPQSSSSASKNSDMNDAIPGSNAHGQEISNRNAVIQSSVPWIWIALLALSASTLIAILISFYLYRWRKILIQSQDVLLPEELAKSIMTFSSDIQQQTKASKLFGREFRDNTSKVTEGIKVLGKSLLTFQKSLEDKDREINRYKSGYDAVILKRNLMGFVRLALFIDEIESESNEVKKIHLLLEDALEDCGVEKFFPEIATSFKLAIGVEEGPEVQRVDDPDLDMKILEVRRPGFQFSQGNSLDTRVILKARVVVGRYVKGEEE